MFTLLHILMHNIVLHIYIYLSPCLYVLCNLCAINNDRKYAILDIGVFISVFLGGH